MNLQRGNCGDDGDDIDNDADHHVDNHHVDDYLTLTLQQCTGISWGLWGEKEEEVKSRFL